MSALAMSSSGFGAEEKAAITQTAPELLAAFSTAWPAGRTDYRTPGDESWKVYATTLRGLAALGKQAVPDIRKGLANPNRQVRALCARALGYLKAEDAVPDLARVLTTDPWPTARLLAADGLGMIHTPQALEALRSAEPDEAHADVALHIGMALKRETGIEDGALKALLQVGAGTLDRAVVGRPAPEFELEDPDGRKVALVDYRGRSAVVLVFFYGDG